MPSNYQAITKHNEEQLGRDTASRKTQISMYSDSTHFVYEILQNADDYGAKEVFFKLSETELWIEHDGEPFIERNVEAITYFGQSTSREDLVKTGRFGVGFKSVFAFTATPIIISGCEHFQIYGLYRVKEYPYPDGFPRSRTRIILPFNHESKNPDYVEDLMSRADAYSKIEERLTSLNKNTLLFTQNIQEIRWETNDGSGYYSRKDDKSNNARMTTITDGEHVKKYLVFSREPIWEGEVHKAVDVAFGIDEKGAITPVPAEEDFLYVLFATKQETHLRFILNGPYRTNPARETIAEDDSFNRHLIKETCDLVEDMLPQIRKKGLLTTKFLAVLPNEDDDTLRDFYKPIMDRLVELFNNEKLTPMKRGVHAAAKGAFRGSTKLSDLIDDKDLARILGDGHSSPLWIKNPPSGSQENRFLSMLEIKEWTTQDLIDKLSEESEMIMKWLARKNYDWHRKLYVLLLDELNELNKSLEHIWYEDSIEQKHKDKLLNLCIIRCIDKKYRKGKDCFFPSDEVKDDKEFPYVAKRLYSSDKDDNQRDRVCEFLKKMEVSEVEESDRVKKILRKRYTDRTNVENVKQYVQDLKQFIRLIKDDSEQTNLFSTYHIFQSKDKIWRKPNEVFLDSPYLDTGLSAYYEAIGDDAQSWEVSEEYEKCGISAKKIGEFAEAVGARTKLCVKEQVIQWRHPEEDKLKIDAKLWPKKNITEKEVNEDYYIQEFDVLLNEPNLRKSQLIWNTMNRLPAYCLKARYRPNSRYLIRQANSILVWRLRKEEWVPQEQDDEDKFSFVKPSDAIIGLLPKGFYTGAEWLEAIELGKWEKQAHLKKKREAEAEQHKQERAYKEKEKAAEIFELPVDQLEELARLNRENPETIQEFLQQQKKKRQTPPFPERKSNNPDRREERVKEQIADAPDKEYKQQQRSVRTTRREIDPRTYLENQYTNNDDQMICQICQEEMPFKKRDGEYYLETVEAFSKDNLPKEHEAQYLALCPECAARYTEFVKNDEGAMKRVYDFLKNSDALEIILQLGERKPSLRFVETHRQDIRTILQNE